MRVYRIYLLLIFMVFFTTGCTSNQDLPDEETTVFSEIETTETAIDREQRIIFSCYATDGLSAYTLTKLIYEQPALNENANLEYTVFSDLKRFNHVISETEQAMVILPFEEALQILQSYKHFSLVGIVQVDEVELSLVVLITEDILENHPEVAKAFIETFSKACEWNSQQRERALAYAEQLNISKGINEKFPEKIVYSSAYDGISVIEETLQSELYENMDINRILESVSRYF